MSSGVCCVTTPVGLALDIARDGVNAAVVPFEDASSVVRRTRELWADTSERRRMQVAARDTIAREMHRATTMPKILQAYHVALDEFARRVGSMRQTTQQPAAARLKKDLGEIQGRVQLKALGAKLRERVTLLEQLHWAESLLLQKQRRLGYTIMLSQCLRYPMSSLPVRYLARNIIPRRLVRAATWIKAAVSASDSRVAEHEAL
jgi:hypothetical protein